jgi:hypothetical protein
LQETLNKSTNNRYLSFIQVEEQPRKLEHVIKVSHLCLYRDQPQLDSKSDTYLEQVIFHFRETATLKIKVMQNRVYVLPTVVPCTLLPSLTDIT